MADDILMIPLSVQCTAFIYAVFSGAVLATVISFFTAARKALPHIGAAVFIEDIICAVLFFAVSFYLLLSFCSGRLRWYIFTGELLGWMIFHLTIGGALTAVFEVIINITHKLMLFIISLAVMPFKFVFKLITKAVITSRKIVHKIFKKIYNMSKLCLKYSSKSLYNSYVGIGMSKNRFGKDVNGLARRKKRRSSFLVRIITFSFVVCAAVSFIHSQSEVASKRRELTVINENIQLQQLENDEIKRILDGNNDMEYIERIAREKLGYAYPDEKIFIDRSGG